MYGLPLSQSDQRIRCVFQSVYNNVSYCLCTQRKFVPEVVPLWLKNRNQRVHTTRIIQGETQMGKGGLIFGLPIRRGGL